MMDGTATLQEAQETIDNGIQAGLELSGNRDLSEKYEDATKMRDKMHDLPY